MYLAGLLLDFLMVLVCGCDDDGRTEKLKGWEMGEKMAAMNEESLSIRKW